MRWKRIKIAAHGERTISAWHKDGRVIYRDLDGQYVVVVGALADIEQSPTGGREVAIVASLKAAKG